MSLTSASSVEPSNAALRSSKGGSSKANGTADQAFGRYVRRVVVEQKAVPVLNASASCRGAAAAALECGGTTPLFKDNAYSHAR